MQTRAERLLTSNLPLIKGEKHFNLILEHMCTIPKISGIVFFKSVRMCYMFKEHLSHKDSLSAPKMAKKTFALLRVLKVSIQLKLSYHLLRMKQFSHSFCLYLSFLMRKTRISERVSDAVLSSGLWNKLGTNCPGKTEI